MNSRFKYVMPINGIIRHVVDEDGTTNLYKETSDGHIVRIEPHPYGIMSPGAHADALREGLPSQESVGHDLLRLFENEDLEHVYSGGWKYTASVVYRDLELDVTVNVVQRRIVGIRLSVMKFASNHAVARAKERYGLILNTETAKEIVDILKTGNKKVLSQKDDIERVELLYDMEIFTVVWDTENEKIITVVPTGE